MYQSQQVRIATVVLAAGGSTRLGQPKQLLPLNNKPILAHVLDTVRDADVDLRYIVLGHAAAEIEGAVSLDGFQTIYNPDYAEGQSTSVRAGIAGISGGVHAVIFVLGDQPLQSARVIKRLADSYRESPAVIIQPQYQEGPGNPVLLDSSLFPDLMALKGDTGARPLIQKWRHELRRIDVSALNRPGDIDTWEDYEHLRQQYATMKHAEGS